MLRLADRVSTVAVALALVGLAAAGSTPLNGRSVEESYNALKALDERHAEDVQREDDRWQLERLKAEHAYREQVPSDGGAGPNPSFADPSSFDHTGGMLQGWAPSIPPSAGEALFLQQRQGLTHRGGFLPGVIGRLLAPRSITWKPGMPSNYPDEESSAADVKDLGHLAATLASIDGEHERRMLDLMSEYRAKRTALMHDAGMRVDPGLPEASQPAYNDWVGRLTSGGQLRVDMPRLPADAPVYRASEMASVTGIPPKKSAATDGGGVAGGSGAKSKSGSAAAMFLQVSDDEDPCKDVQDVNLRESSGGWQLRLCLLAMQQKRDMALLVNKQRGQEEYWDVHSKMMNNVEEQFMAPEPLSGRNSASNLQGTFPTSFDAPKQPYGAGDVMMPPGSKPYRRRLL